MLSSSADLKTSACTANGRPHPALQRALAAVPAEVLDKFYGCGAPLPLGIAGLRVLDLGCGSGRDCYAAAALGAAAVTGVDMTLTQLAVRHLVLRPVHRAGLMHGITHGVAIEYGRACLVVYHSAPTWRSGTRKGALAI